MNRACRKNPSRLCAEGPLVPYLESYADYLAERGYSQVSFWKKTFLISEFNRWLDREGVPVDAIKSEHEEAFLRDLSRRRRPKGGDCIAVSEMTNWLRENDVIQCRAAMLEETSDIDRILLEYRTWLHEDRGLTPATIGNYNGNVKHFLMAVSDRFQLRLTSLRSGQIAEYIRRIAPKGRTFAAAKHIVTALRSFFRFAQYRGYILIDLAGTVPSVAGWSMASIPRAMPAEQVKLLLTASKTWRTPCGLRDRAVLLLLARLGLRAREIIRLELDDIDWNEGCLRFSSKERAERPLPLPHDVGEAIVTYLQHGRPRSTCRRLFLRACAPFDDLKSSSDICQIVARAIKRVGIEPGSKGAHQFRHALAVDMLRQGASLTDIGQILRHRSPDTTRQYAKIDLNALREVALPWPGALP